MNRIEIRIHEDFAARAAEFHGNSMENEFYSRKSGTRNCSAMLMYAIRSDRDVNYRKFEGKSSQFARSFNFRGTRVPGTRYKPATFNHYEIRITSCCRIVVKPNPRNLATYDVVFQSRYTRRGGEEDAAKENRDRGKHLLDGVRNQRPRHCDIESPQS